MPVKKNKQYGVPRLSGLSEKLFKHQILTTGSKLSYWVPGQDDIGCTVLGAANQKYATPDADKADKNPTPVGPYKASTHWPFKGAVLRVPKVVRWINCFQYQAVNEDGFYRGGDGFDCSARVSNCKTMSSFFGLSPGFRRNGIDLVYYDWYWTDDYRTYYDNQQQWENVGYDQYASLFEALTPDIFSDMLTTLFTGSGVDNQTIIQNVPNIPPHFLCNVLNVVIFADLGAEPSIFATGSNESVAKYDDPDTFTKTWANLVALHQMLNQWFYAFNTIIFYDMTPPADPKEKFIGIVRNSDGDLSEKFNTDLFPLYGEQTVANISDVLQNQPQVQFGLATISPYNRKSFVRFGGKITNYDATSIVAGVKGHFGI